jgi:hypothetical protein
MTRPRRKNQTNLPAAWRTGRIILSDLIRRDAQILDRFNCSYGIWRLLPLCNLVFCMDHRRTRRNYPKPTKGTVFREHLV